MLCGGVFLYGKGRDRLPEKTITQWTQVRSDPTVMKFGSDSCPVDSGKLSASTDKTVQNLNVRRCSTCKGWWFPTESLFLYDPAGLKANSWEVVFRATRTLILASLLIFGIVTGVRMVGTKQQSQIQAAQEVRSWSATYLGNGTEQISFISMEKYFSVPYRVVNGEWKYTPTSDKDYKYVFTINGLQDNLTYEVIVGQKSYYFNTR